MSKISDSYALQSIFPLSYLESVYDRHKQPHLRGVSTTAAANFEDQVAEAAFMDGRLRDDWDYFSFHGDDLDDKEEMDDYVYDLDEDEAETEQSSSFVASSRFSPFPPKKSADTADNGPRANHLVQHCVQWSPSNDPACLRGGRSLRCAPGFKTQKCFYCRVDEAFDRRTFECIPRSVGSDSIGVKHCFRWHPNAPCRKGARAGFCTRGWVEKCIRCRSGEGVNRRTGECASQGRSNEGGGSGDNSDGKVERCFRWHSSSSCRRGGRAGRCIRGWEEKCIRCRRNEVVSRETGECVPLRE